MFANPKTSADRTLGTTALSVLIIFSQMKKKANRRQTQTKTTQVPLPRTRKVRRRVSTMMKTLSQRYTYLLFKTGVSKHVRVRFGKKVSIMSNLGII